MKAFYTGPFRFLMIAALLFISFNVLQGQVAVPYSNNFDQPEDTTGWTHYAITGTDDWELGAPVSASYSDPNVWATDLDGSYSQSSNRALVTPAFDLSSIGENYHLSFFNRRQGTSAGTSYYVEYAVNDGLWQILNNATVPKRNWMGTTGFTSNNLANYSNACINLSFLAGLNNVKFRFRFVTPASGSTQGWLIDNFSIAEDYFNVNATVGDPIHISQNCAEITVNSDLIYQNQYTDSYQNTTLYYFSTNTILDDQDQLIFSKLSNVSSTDTDLAQDIPMTGVLTAGNYYVLYYHDALDSLEEADETDNIGWATIEVDSVYNTPYIDAFDSGMEPWETYFSSASSVPVWEMGSGYRHHLEGTHSGENAWHTSSSIQADQGLTIAGTHYVESPYVNLSTIQGEPVLNLWYKNQIDGNEYRIEHSLNCGYSFTNLYSFEACDDDEWDYVNIPLSDIVLNDDVRFRLTFNSSYLKPEGIIFDDFYVGVAKADLTIEREKAERFTSGSETNGSLKYYLNNCGMVDATATSTSFYWSEDAVFDASDVYIGNKQEDLLNAQSAIWTTFEFTKPTVAEGIYYIFYTLDSEESLDEMREYNNGGYFTLHQQQTLSLPYENDFETEIDQWRHNASLGTDDWKWAVPNGTFLDEAFSGEKAMLATGINAPLTPMSRSHLYSPVFDLTSIEHPVMEMDMKLLSNGTTRGNGKMNMSYSVDGGATWIVLDTNSQSFNRWYYWMEYDSGRDRDYYMPLHSELLFAHNDEPVFPGSDDYNGRDAARNTHYVLDLAFLADMPQVQFRYNLGTLTNVAWNNNPPAEGVMVDNFIIREAFTDLLVDYQKSLLISSLVEDVRFFMQIKNQGNFLTSEGLVNYYLSADTQLDASDFFLGNKILPPIRPDLYHYVNVSYTAPSDLENYAYLIYELDATDLDAESNETNNEGYWPLALDGVQTFPYLADLNTAVVDGWHQFSIDNFSDTLGRYRFRNIVAPGEPLYQTDVESGQFFTERIPDISQNWIPTFYLESPAFDFSGTDSVHLSFDLMCTGIHSTFTFDGGNLQFSTDGGNTWTVLTEAYGEAYNWYNYEEMEGLDFEDGWSRQPAGYAVASWDSCAIDVSFLAGQPHVVFRFKYRSNHRFYGGGTVQGMRVDNFGIRALTVDLVANDLMIPVDADITLDNFDITYSLDCLGQNFSGPTQTKFFWSADDVLDSSDPLVLTQEEGEIAHGSTHSATINIEYPTPVLQSTYYLFYKADHGDDILESNEDNNIGTYIIHFPGFVVGVENHDTSNMSGYVVDHILYLNTKETQALPSMLKLTNMKGQLVYSTKVNPVKGVNAYALPSSLAVGVYHVSVENGQGQKVLKVVLR